MNELLLQVHYIQNNVTKIKQLTHNVQVITNVSMNTITEHLLDIDCSIHKILLELERMAEATVTPALTSILEMKLN